jgi:phosphopantothenoylcysteine decarboxylase/phosphopantothenate--cysteine ligase
MSASPPDNKRILLGVTGGIAAYKSATLVRRLQDKGCEVQVMMTENAARFVAPLTFSTLSQRPVYTSQWPSEEQPAESDIRHISLSDWTDLAVVAPATANFIGKVAGGIADDLLTTTMITLTCPILLCPSMSSTMYTNSIVAENIGKLRGHGYHIMEPGTGELACKKTGPGRLPEPDEIVKEIERLLDA